jgi:hypothetical protein
LEPRLPRRAAIKARLSRLPSFWGTLLDVAARDRDLLASEESVIGAVARVVSLTARDDDAVRGVVVLGIGIVVSKLREVKLGRRSTRSNLELFQSDGNITESRDEALSVISLPQ